MRFDLRYLCSGIAQLNVVPSFILQAKSCSLATRLLPVLDLPSLGVLRGRLRLRAESLRHSFPVSGFYQASTKSGASCLGVLNDLEERGLPRSGILFVVDGGSGLNKALEERYAVHDPKKTPDRPCSLLCS